MKAFLAAFDDMPVGAFDAQIGGARYHVVKSVHAGGKSQKLVAREVGGSDYISLNLYRLRNGRALLKPCEMPEAKVVDFVLRAVVGGPGSADMP